MKKQVSFVLAAFVAAVSVATAQAGPISFAVDSTHSSLGVSVSLLSGVYTTPPVSGPLSGAAPGVPFAPLPGAPTALATTGLLADLAQSGAIPGTLKSYGGGMQMQTLSFGIPTIPFVGSFTASLIVPHFVLGIGAFPTATAGVGTATYNVSGTSVMIDAGQFSYAGSGLVLGLIGSNTINLPTLGNVNLPSGTFATLTEGVGPPNAMPVTLSVPINFQQDLVPGLLALSYSGTAVFTGVRIPEPGSMLLLAVGAVGLVPVIRRRLARNR